MTETTLEAVIRWPSGDTAAWASAAAAAALSFELSVCFDPGGSKHKLYPKSEGWSKLRLELRNFVFQTTNSPLALFLGIYSMALE